MNRHHREQRRLVERLGGRVVKSRWNGGHEQVVIAAPAGHEIQYTFVNRSASPRYLANMEAQLRRAFADPNNRGRT